jgi:hypothetical protein
VIVISQYHREQVPVGHAGKIARTRTRTRAQHAHTPARTPAHACNSLGAAATDPHPQNPPPPLPLSLSQVLAIRSSDVVYGDVIGCGSFAEVRGWVMVRVRVGERKEMQRRE